MEDITERVQRHLVLHAKGVPDAAYWALLADIGELVDEIERLRAENESLRRTIEDTLEYHCDAP
jgi:cell division protein FtsB